MLKSFLSLGNIRVPVCNIFKKKIIEGHVCYEAGIRKELETGRRRKKTAPGTLSLVIDTNEEYDVRHLLESESHQTKETQQHYYAFKQSGDPNGMTVLFRSTISKY